MYRDEYHSHAAAAAAGAVASVAAAAIAAFGTASFEIHGESGARGPGRFSSEPHRKKKTVLHDKEKINSDALVSGARKTPAMFTSGYGSRWTNHIH